MCLKGQLPDPQTIKKWLSGLGRQTFSNNELSNLYASDLGGFEPINKCNPGIFNAGALAAQLRGRTERYMDILLVVSYCATTSRPLP